MLSKLRHTLEWIKFSHTIFALPFALAAYFVATGGRLQVENFFWILLCLVTARSAAMGFNRIVDAKMDGRNPRTRRRHLPAGVLSFRYAVGFVVTCSLLFVFSASQLNLVCFYLSPFCLGLLFFYSYTKRFTHWTQFFLGISLGVAPVAATLAVLGKITPDSLILGAAVLFWVMGFDLLYALQDWEFDREAGVFSLPVKLGVRGSFVFSKIFHGLFLFLLATYGYYLKFGLIYWVGLGVIGVLVFWQHFLLREDLRRIEAAFFTSNGLLSLVFFALVLADRVVGRF